MFIFALNACASGVTSTHLCLHLCLAVSSMFSSGNYDNIMRIRSWIYLELVGFFFFLGCKLGSLFQTSAHIDPIFAVPFFEEIVLFFPGLVLVCLSKTSCLWVCGLISGDCIAPLICMSSFVPIPGCFNYNCLVKCLDAWCCHQSRFLFIA